MLALDKLTKLEVVRKIVSSFKAKEGVVKGFQKLKEVGFGHLTDGLSLIVEISYFLLEMLAHVVVDCPVQWHEGSLLWGLVVEFSVCPRLDFRGLS